MATKAYYNLYSVKEVFSPSSVNVVCNQMMQGLIDQKFSNLNSHFAMAGEAAENYVNKASGPIQNVRFETDEREIYIFIANNLKKFCPQILSLQIYEEKIIAEFKDTFIEFFLMEKIYT